MADIDINQVTQAVVANLRSGATDMAGITPSESLADSDNVLAQNGATLKKLPVSLFKKIVASGATVYRLVVSSQVFKADTTSVTIGLTKSEGGTVTDLSVLPTGWKIGVAYSSGESTKSEVLSVPGSIDPHAWSEVVISLCDGDPSLSATNVLDQATLRLVSDGAKGDKGDTGAQGPQGEKGADGAAGKDGADGARANSLILQPFNDYPCYNVTALDYETGIVTLDEGVDDSIAVGDYVAVTLNTSLVNGNYFTPLAKPMTYTYYHHSNYAFLLKRVTAVEGKTVTIDGYLLAGKGALASPTHFMLVHYGAAVPTNTYIELPEGYRGKALRLDLLGQSVSAGGWNNWAPDVCKAKSVIAGPSGDRGHGTLVYEQVDYYDGWVVSRDYANIFGIDTRGSYRQKFSPIRRTYDLAQVTTVQLPYQISVPYNTIIISLL